MSRPQPTPSGPECVKVMVRVRPMNSSESEKGCENIVSADRNTKEITLSKPKDDKEPPKVFAFDAIFGLDIAQKTIYEESAFPLVESVLEGYNGTIFAYGQTGCGKTYTMVGEEEESKQGIIPSAFNHIFGGISSFGKEKRFLLRCSYLEIYNENIHDLLEYDAEKKLELKEEPQRGVYVKGLTTVIVRSVPDIKRTMDNGAANRHTAETMMNKTSSRSHSIFTIYIETAETQQDGSDRMKAGKLNLVDLAGSERQSKTMAEGMRLKEATKINLSLSALGNVISALVDGKSSHIPYRDSKLTRLLQDSLGGNTKTVMIACVSPASYNYDETLSTLRYASRAKHIQNKPHVNEDPKDALLRQYENEIKSLREMLGSLAKGGAVGDRLKAMEKLQRVMTDQNALRFADQLQGAPNKTLEELEAEKALLHKDKERAETQLKEKEKDFLTEKEQRNKLEEMIRQAEQTMLTGGAEFEERAKEQSEKYKQMQLQLRKQRAKEKKLLEEKQKKEKEMLEVEKEYKNIQDELRDKTSLIKDLGTKTELAASEIKDIQQEHQTEKESLLESIRDQNRELDFYKRVVEIMMSEGEMKRIKGKAVWDEEAEAWKIPTFVVQSKQVMLPMLSKAQGGEEAEEDKQGRTQEGTGLSGLLKPTVQETAAGTTCESFVGKPVNVKPSRKAESTSKEVEEREAKHMFNWSLLSKGKYNDKKQKGTDSPSQAALRKNAHLDALPYNPADHLSPIDEDDIKRRLGGQDQTTMQPQKKTKVLAKIDDSLLSSVAKTPLIGIDLAKSPTGNNGGQWGAGKIKRIFGKLPALKNE